MKYKHEHCRDTGTYWTGPDWPGIHFCWCPEGKKREQNQFNKYTNDELIEKLLDLHDDEKRFSGSGTCLDVDARLTKEIIIKEILKRMK